MVMTQVLIAVLPVIAVVTATAIYLNRKRSDRLYQRFFGMEDDPNDEGYIPYINEKLEGIDKNVKELNHERIDNIENRLDKLQESIEGLKRREDN